MLKIETIIRPEALHYSLWPCLHLNTGVLIYLPSTPGQKFSLIKLTIRFPFNLLTWLKFHDTYKGQTWYVYPINLVAGC